MEKLIIGSRGSKLALKYAEIAKKAFLKELDIEIEIKKITTEGDLDPVVRTIELGGSSIDLMIVAYADPMGFAAFNEVKENLIFNIMKIVKSNKSEFAYPSTSLYVESMPK